MHDDIGQIVNMPEGHTVAFVSRAMPDSSQPPPHAVRVTDDPTAPFGIVIDRNHTHPYRQKEVIARLATLLPGRRINQHDMQCVRKVFADEIEAGGFVYRPLHSSAQYSEGLVDWIVGKASEDPSFFESARAACKQPKVHA